MCHTGVCVCGVNNLNLTLVSKKKSNRQQTNVCDSIVCMCNKEVKCVTN